MSLVYRREGYAQTRDALAWVGAYAPKLKFGLTLEQVFEGLEHGYQSVRPLLYDSERISTWDRSRKRMQEAYALFKRGAVVEGKRAMAEAEELFTTLRQIDGKKVSRQTLGDTEHGANAVDE